MHLTVINCSKILIIASLWFADGSQLPCEFCNKSFPADVLILHQVCTLGFWGDRYEWDDTKAMFQLLITNLSWMMSRMLCRPLQVKYLQVTVLKNLMQFLQCFRGMSLPASWASVLVRQSEHAAGLEGPVLAYIPVDGLILPIHFQSNHQCP